MKRHLPTIASLLVLLVASGGCAAPVPPNIEKGMFGGEKTFVVQRACVEVIVETEGEGTYEIVQQPYTHPMSPPGDTEITITMPAGTFVIENHGLVPDDKVRVNGTVHEFPDPEFKWPSCGRRRLRIAKDGSVTATVDEIRPQP
jgi:hypothetical protein